MRPFLEAVASRGWASAFFELQASSPEDASMVYRTVFDPKRALGSYFLPVGSSSRALDISCGIEGVARFLAHTCGEVVSVGDSQGRLDSDRALYEFEGLNNVSQIRADLSSTLPLAPDQFDIVALNDALDRIPEIDGGNPREAQIRFLKEISRVLKPGGVVLAGVENRLSHLNLRSRGSRGDFRNYSYTARGYERLFRDSGLNAVHILPVTPDHRFPAEVHDLSSREGARYPLRRGFSRKESWTERIRASRTFLRHLSNSYLMLASPRSPLPDSIMDHVRKRLEEHPGIRPVRLLRFTASAAGALALFAGEAAQFFLRIGHSPNHLGRLARNASALKAMEGIFPAGHTETARVPSLLLEEHRGGHFFTVEEGLPGTRCGVLMKGTDRERILEGLSAFLGEFGRRTLSADGTRWLKFRKDLSRKVSELGDAMVDERYRTKLERLGAMLEEGLSGPSPATVWTHGDFNVGNCLWDERRHRLSGLIDWDQSWESAPPGIDLINLFLDLRNTEEPATYRGQRILKLLDGPWSPDEERLWQSYHLGLGAPPLGRDILIQIGWINSAWNGFHTSDRRLDYSVVRADVHNLLDHLVR